MSAKINVGRISFYGLLVFSSFLIVKSQAAPAPQAILAGPVIPGVCVLNQQGLFDTSKVGKVASARYKQLRDQAQTTVNAAEAKIVADSKTLTAQKNTLPVAQFQQRQQDLMKRFQDLRTQAAQSSQELDATRQGVVVKISEQAQPIVAQVYQSRHCGLLLAKVSVLAGNPAMDITAAVVQGLDAKITTISFDREHLKTASAAPTR